ncbi:hypothetical protein KKD04_02445, partial [Patescibacteria group bacterium]|nr:hypothetical protein [Patescibacteria group bacterium]
MAAKTITIKAIISIDVNTLHLLLTKITREKVYIKILLFSPMFSKLKEKLKNWAKKLSEKTEEKIEIKPAEKEKSPKRLKKEPHIKKEIEIPTKFNVGLEKYESDLEKLEEIEKDIEKEIGVEETPKKESFLKKIKVKFYSTEISKQDFDKYSEELEMLLVENNVALEVAE